MVRNRSLPFPGATWATAALLTPWAGAQFGAPVQRATVPGQVLDLAVAADGALLYVKGQELGRITSAGAVSALSNGPFGLGARAVQRTPGGPIAVLDTEGDLHHVPAAGGAPTLVYDDLFLVNDPTDLVVDAAGVHLIAGATVSTGVRGLAFVDVPAAGSPGQKPWSYYLVEPSLLPLALATDGLTGGLLGSDAAGSGALRAIATAGAAPQTSAIDAVTAFQFVAAELGADLAGEADGDLWVVSGNRLYFHARFAGTTQLVHNGGGVVRRGLVLAPSSVASGSSTGWSAWFAEQDTLGGDTRIYELASVGAPAAAFPDSLGAVPWLGSPVGLSPVAQNIYTLVAGADGRLYYGGDVWDANAQVRSVDPNDGSTLLEAQIPGPNGRVEGLAVAADGTVRALSQQGRIYRVENDPATPSLLFADPFDQLAPMLGNGASTKGLVVDRAGVSYTVERSSFNNGRLWRVDPAQAGASDLGPVQDGRGLAGDPFENRLLCAEWGGAGFNGRVAEVNESSFGLLTVPGLAPLNYSNGVVWGDGDILVDSQGGIYTVCEDEFAVYRLDRDSGQRVRIASGYLNHPGGFALAPSRASTPSSTGWSLYLHDRSQLFELPGFPAPAPRNLDRSAPPIGAPVGFVDPRHGRPRCALLSPEGGAALVGTDSGRLVRVPLDGSPATLLAGPVQGLSGDLRDLAATPDGQVLAARADGAVYRIGPATGWLPTLFFADPGNLLNDVRGLAVDSAGRVFLSDRPAQYPAAGRLWRLIGGTTLVQVAFTARGTRPAIDPLTGDVFLAQEGAPNATRGEILRATATQAPALVGSDAPADQSAPRGFALGGFDGALCFDLAGHQYLAEGDLGRIVRLDRSASTTSILAGSYDRPLDLFLAPGTPGIAGPQGTSLFVLDGYALYEHGVAGQIPAVAAGPSGGAPAELRARGLALFGATTAVQIQRPAAAGAIYLLLPGLFGKEPGFPLALIGNPFDPRVVPQNFDPLLWTALSSPALPGALGVLDGAGQSPPLLGVNLPASPALQGLGAFLDLTWLQVDPFTFSGVAHIGGTSQIFLGQ